MPEQLWSGDRSRKIVTRMVVEGDLVLETPTHFGSGDSDDLTDMPLLVDPLDGRRPLLPGASIAGALRGYLRDREHGYRQCESAKSASVLLFGCSKGDPTGEQSPLIVDDALGKDYGIEVREGVRLNACSRTAEQNALFNLQVWQAGTRFKLRFELLVREGDDPDNLKRALATALAGFNDGGIVLGARKRRGYGQVSVPEWRVTTYDLTTPDGLLAWTVAEHDGLRSTAPAPQSSADLAASLGDDQIKDKREAFTIKATFTLDGSLLIRSGSGSGETGPDVVHLHARRTNGDARPVLSGTSLGGALRARALKIANTISPQGRHMGKRLIDEMWGADMKELEKRRQEGDADARAYASRLTVQETVVNKARTDLVQNRVSIDRFTGGASDTALFSEQPAFGSGETVVTAGMSLIGPGDHEIGLLSLLLKDLWTGDLPLGGESSVGRGRLKGKSATLTRHNGNGPQEWGLVANDSGLTITTGDRDFLERCVRKLSDHLKEATP